MSVSSCSSSVSEALRLLSFDSNVIGFLPLFEVRPLPIASSPFPFVASCLFFSSLPILFDIFDHLFHSIVPRPCSAVVVSLCAPFALRFVASSHLFEYSVSAPCLLVRSCSWRVLCRPAPFVQVDRVFPAPLIFAQGGLLSTTCDVRVPHYGVRNSVREEYGIQTCWYGGFSSREPCAVSDVCSPCHFLLYNSTVIHDTNFWALPRTPVPRVYHAQRIQRIHTITNNVYVQ